MSRPKVGVSACLLGERVRYDGDHRLDPYVAVTLGGMFEWVAVCPETEAGFGVPRETLRLEGETDRPRLITTETRLDRTATMRAWCEARVASLPEDLCGFVWKAGSPSCGPSGVKLYTEGMVEPQLVAAGLFARAVRERFPELPVIDEEGLLDPVGTEAFIQRARALHRSRMP